MVTRLPLGINASFQSGALLIVTKSGLLQITAAPHVQASKLSIDTGRWTSCFPRLPLDHIVHVLDGIESRSQSEEMRDDVRTVFDQHTLRRIEALHFFVTAVGTDLCRTVASPPQEHRAADSPCSH